MVASYVSISHCFQPIGDASLSLKVFLEGKGHFTIWKGGGVYFTFYSNNHIPVLHCFPLQG